jgi:hypothetical protein
MDFFIRKNSTLPLLKLELVDDGKTDKSQFNDMLENSTISLNLYNIDDNSPYILKAPCYLTTKTYKYSSVSDNIVIAHNFTNEETKKVGRYEAIITINFRDTEQVIINTIKLPIREKLYINII